MVLVNDTVLVDAVPRSKQSPILIGAVAKSLRFQDT